MGHEALWFPDLQADRIQVSMRTRVTDLSRSLVVLKFLPLSPSERFQQEVDRVLDGKDRVQYEDRHQMPYVQVNQSER